MPYKELFGILQLKNMTLSEINKNKKIFAANAKAQLMKTMTYKTDFYMITLASYGYNIVALIFLYVLFDNFDSIAGWTKYQVILLYALGQIVFYTYAMFGWGIEHLGEHIRWGRLDMLLVKPVNPIFNLVSKFFSFFDFLPSAIFAYVVYLYAIYKLDISLIFAFIAVIPATVGGALVAFLMFLIMGTLTFWLSDTNMLKQGMANIFDMNRYPLGIFPKTIQPILFTILPIALLSYIPTYFIVFGFNLSYFLVYSGTLISFILISVFLWKNGVKAYSSASS